MVNAIETARKVARQAQEILYDGVCTITEYREAAIGTSRITRHNETVIAKDIPCRLSYETISAAEQGEAAAVIQGVKIFLAPEIKVNAGSKIAVTQNGRTAEYAMSGEAAVYSTHQEIKLEIFKGWA